jgi:hypothetical protein
MMKVVEVKLKECTDAKDAVLRDLAPGGDGAATVAAMTSSLWVDETKPASYADGAK